MIQLRGEKVILGTMEREHCRKLWLDYEPEEPLTTQPLKPGLSIEGADKWFEEIQSKQGKKQVYLGVFTPEGDIIGDVQLSNIDWVNRTATLGLGFSLRRDRGQGYGTDAAITILKYGFEHLNLFRISASTYEYNEAGKRSLEKIGFACEGQQRKAVFCGGKRWDCLLYGLLREDFENRAANG